MTVQTLSTGRERGHRYVNIAGRQCLDTGAVVIGSLHIPRPPAATRDGVTLQAALLEPRTAKPLPRLYAVIGKAVAWL